MKLLKSSKNRTFNYQPRFSGENKSLNTSDSESKNDFVSKWKEKHKQNRKVKSVLPMWSLLLLLVLLLLGIYALDMYIN
ncbi:MAG: hypothetical protein IE891_09980 [Flavobacteriaceae bacterium]|nr:hypothetical protein [Flavobacteriaceae bacterium]